jgi:hypothetical protein
MDGLLGFFEQQFKKGEPYREAVRGLLRGDTSGFDKLNAPTVANPQEAVDIATGFAGTIKPVQAKVFQEAFDLAQQRAALPIAEGGLGLPANNTAMDRAKAMGFETPAYHGTDKDFPAFDKKFDRLDRGFWFGTEDVANKFASTDNRLIEGGNIIPALIKQKNPYIYDATDLNRPKNLKDIFENLDKSKNDGIKFIGGQTSAFTVNQPNQIRSRFAAFDPFRRNENDLLAGVAAVPVGLLEMNKEKKKKKNK